MASLQSPTAERKPLVEFTTPFSAGPSVLGGSIEETPAGQPATPRHEQEITVDPAENTACLRFALGTVLPIVMITVGMYIQKTSHAGGRFKMSRR